MTDRILVAGLGNIFLGDDGWGVEVARRLAGRPRPEGVKVADFGIRGLHLAYELLEEYDLVVFVDAVRRGDEPGTVTVIEPDLEGLDTDAAPEAHGMDPVTVLSLLSGLGGRVERLLLVACEVAVTEEEMGLSAAVEAAVDPAVAVVEELVAEHMSALAGRES